MIWRANTSTECDYFNDRWLLFRGRTMDQETGNQWAEGVHPEDFDHCLKTYLEFFGRREIFETHYRIKHADGEYRWIFDRGFPFYADDGAFQGYIGSGIDVTERVLARRPGFSNAPTNHAPCSTANLFEEYRSAGAGVVLQESNGPAVARKVKNLQPCMRLLYISGFSLPELQRRGLLSQKEMTPGAVEFLQKPFSSEQFLDHVKKLLPN
jgi:PAS domain S-box-containing protein